MRMKTVLAVGLGLLALLSVVSCLLVFVVQRDLLYHPRPRKVVPETRLHAISTPAGLVHATVWPDRESGSQKGAVLYLGGNAEDTAASVPALAKAFPGRVVYAVHYRGWAESAGSPTEDALVSDAIRWFDELAGRHADVTVIGRSLGSGIAVQVAARRAVERLVLVSPYDSVLAVARRHFPFLPVSWLLQDRYLSTAHAPGVGSPTLILAAASDRVIPPAHARILMDAFSPGVAHMVTLPGVGHDDISRHPDYWRLVAGAPSLAPPPASGTETVGPARSAAW